MSDWHRNRRRAQESELQVCAAYRLGSTQQLAEAFGIDQATVRNMLRRNNIKARGRSESMKLRCKDRLFVENRARKLRGKPSGAFGRRWKIGRSIKKSTLRGAGNPSWKGGTTSLSQLIRCSEPYYTWRRAVFARDNATCVLCGASRHGPRKTRAALEADHIVRFADLLKFHRITSVDEAMSCASLWDVNNGRTLCKSCHTATTTYGTRRGGKAA